MKKNFLALMLLLSGSAMAQDTPFSIAANLFDSSKKETMGLD
jgi:hypothetical protein